MRLGSVSPRPRPDRRPADLGGPACPGAGGGLRVGQPGALEPATPAPALAAHGGQRSDRFSSYQQWSLPLDDALLTEFHHGMATLQTGEMLDGLDRYGTGRWRAERCARPTAGREGT